MSKHTPGPWTRCLSKESGGSFITHIDADYVGHDVCFVYASHGMFDPVVTTEQDDANARLIAQAPRLLEDLEDLLAKYEVIVHDQYDGTSLIETLLADADKARTTIKAAKGESND